MNFSEIFAQALTPVTLISGVGLLLLSMVNRYNHLTSRARSLYKECLKSNELTSQDSVKTLLRRCTHLRNAIMSLLMTVALSGLLIALMAIANWSEFSFDYLIWFLLLAAIFFLLLGLGLFARDFRVSLNALRKDLVDK